MNKNSATKERTSQRRISGKRAITKERSPLAIDRALVPRNPNETYIGYEERLLNMEMELLESQKGDLLPEEKERLERHYANARKVTALRDGALVLGMVDSTVQSEADWLRREFVSQYGDDTPVKRTLIDRLIASWSMALSCEKIFFVLKYKSKENSISFDCDSARTHRLAEARKGIEMANNQILRFTQALENLRRPPVNFKIKNAYIAQNQQINHGTPPKDLEKNPDHPDHVEIDRRALP